MPTNSPCVAPLRAPVLGIVVALSISIAGAADGSFCLECGSWPPYAREEALAYGDYVVCVWQSADEAAPSFYRVVTIERAGERARFSRVWTGRRGSARYRESTSIEAGTRT